VPVLVVPDQIRGLREISLFAGVGGGVLASRLLGWETVAYVEWDDFAKKVLEARIADGSLHDAPIFSDVREFDGDAWRGKADVISAGFPCQPFSVAGRREGENDERNMWPDTARVIREVRPSYAFLENVPGLLAGDHGYFGTILGELAESRYDAVWDVIPASAVGAPHRRDRLWILAYRQDLGRPDAG
jgi:DNA (cytosine-5)-methyltransferase 1